MTLTIIILIGIVIFGLALAFNNDNWPPLNW